MWSRGMRRGLQRLPTNRSLFLRTSLKRGFISSGVAQQRAAALDLTPWLVASAGAGLLLCSNNVAHADAAENAEEVGALKDGLPFFTLKEVATRNSAKTGIWIIYKNGVYDITDFVEKHPGGPRILLAAGDSIEPFWQIFRHPSSAMDMLEAMRIGNVSDDERNKLASPSNLASDDPYSNEPRRLPSFRVNSLRPFNAEPPCDILADTFITPNALFFIRNHHPVPVVDPSEYRLHVGGQGVRETSLSLDDIKSKFRKTTVTATIQCAGNRRSEMSAVKEVRGLNWGKAAISNATWSGARLRDVLRYCGFSEEEIGGDGGVRHVQFEALDFDATGSTPYGASIPVDKAWAKEGDVLLAYEMNGEPIPLDHGFPVRVIVPGVVGARNVKWVSKVIASKEESNTLWQRKDYKGLSPSMNWETLDYEQAPSIQELPVQSAITSPPDNVVLHPDEDEVTVRGYAWSGGGRSIVRVDVSSDGEQTWHTATLLRPSAELNKGSKQWAWTLWEASVPVPQQHSGSFQVAVKAVDESYNSQPDHVSKIWNLRGLLSTAFHRINVIVSDDEDEEEEEEEE